jgi:hypothetical protein
VSIATGLRSASLFLSRLLNIGPRCWSVSVQRTVIVLHDGVW